MAKSERDKAIEAAYRAEEQVREAFNRPGARWERVEGDHHDPWVGHDKPTLEAVADLVGRDSFAEFMDAHLVTAQTEREKIMQASYHHAIEETHKETGVRVDSRESVTAIYSDAIADLRASLPPWWDGVEDFLTAWERAKGNQEPERVTRVAYVRIRDGKAYRGAAGLLANDSIEGVTESLVEAEEQRREVTELSLQKRFAHIIRESEGDELLVGYDTGTFYRLRDKAATRREYPEVVRMIEARAYAAKNADRVDLEHLDRVPSMQPAQTIDRAVRGSSMWGFDESYGLFAFYDPNNSKSSVVYADDTLELEALREEVLKLSPEVADVWRLITAASLENWIDGQNLPEPITVDINDLCRAMGYKPAKNGGFKAESKKKAIDALTHLTRLWIHLDPGSEVYAAAPQGGQKRRKELLKKRVTSQVLNIRSKTEEVSIFGETYPFKWTLLPGDWIKHYPKKQYAKIYRGLVELPARKGKNTWAKAIGTELSYQYRQDQNGASEKTLRVETLLRRACLLEEAKKGAGRGDADRMRKYFEGALDIVQGIGVCVSWEYNAEDYDRIEGTPRRGRGWFTEWLGARVKITAPDSLMEGLPQNQKKSKALTKGRRKK